MCDTHLAFALALGLGSPLVGVAAEPRTYPDRPVRVLMPYPPGGGTDTIGRVLAQRLAGALGQPFVVDNRTGAAGTIATDIAAKAPRDGHTLLVSNISLAVNASHYPKLPYDTLKDLAALSMIGQQPNVLVVTPPCRRKPCASCWISPGPVRGSSPTAPADMDHRHISPPSC